MDSNKWLSENGSVPISSFHLVLWAHVMYLSCTQYVLFTGFHNCLWWPFWYLPMWWWDMCIRVTNVMKVKTVQMAVMRGQKLVVSIPVAQRSMQNVLLRLVWWLNACWEYVHYSLKVTRYRKYLIVWSLHNLHAIPLMMCWGVYTHGDWGLCARVRCNLVNRLYYVSIIWQWQSTWLCSQHTPQCFYQVETESRVRLT